MPRSQPTDPHGPHPSPRPLAAQPVPEAALRWFRRAGGGVRRRSRPARLGWALAALLLAATACTRGDAPPAPSSSASAEGAAGAGQRIRYQGSVGAVLFQELAEDLGYLAPLRLEWIGNTISGPQDIQSVLTGDVDVGGAFNGAIVTLRAAGAPLRSVIGYYGIDDESWSGFYVLEGSAIHTARDLIGKTVSMNTLGAHMEFMLREYLTRAGLAPHDIEQVSRIAVPPISGEQSLRQGQVDVATLGNMIRDKALERGGLRLLFSDHELYPRLTAGSLVFHERFIREHPDTVRSFVTATARAIEWARSRPRDEVQQRFRAILRRRGRSEDDSLVPYWKSTGVAGTGGRMSDAEFQLWIDWLVKDGQLQPGQLQPTDLYTNAFNDYREQPS